MRYNYDHFYAPAIAEELHDISDAITSIDSEDSVANYLYALLGYRLDYLAGVVDSAKKEEK